MIALVTRPGIPGTPKQAFERCGNREVEAGLRAEESRLRRGSPDEKGRGRVGLRAPGSQNQAADQRRADAGTMLVRVGEYHRSFKTAL